VTSGLLNFADDTKIFGVVASQDDVRKLQEDLKNLCRWSRHWLMLSNVENAKFCSLDTIIRGKNTKWIVKLVRSR
jgi:hypothetical protein